MDAFLLAAGVGSRLRPLTNLIPKPIVELNGRPLIDRNLECLKKAGCSRVIINTHYLPQHIYDYVEDGSKWGLEILYSYESELLDTGGGLRNIFDYIRTENFITWNADVFIDPLFMEVADGFARLKSISESKSQPLITLLVKEEEEVKKIVGEAKFTILEVDDENNLIGFLEKKYSEADVSKKVIFCGISIISKKIFSYFPSNCSIFSLTKDVFPAVLQDVRLKEQEKIKVSYCNYYWNDIGTPERLVVASNNLK